MLSRVAENIYWLSRYLERAENTVRLVNTHGYMLLDLPVMDEHQAWIPLIIINGQGKEFIKQHGSACERSVNHFLLADNDNSGSLVNGFRAVQNNLRCCRDIIPKSSYEAINSLCRYYIEEVHGNFSDPANRTAFLRHIEGSLLAISGGINSNMSHDLAYRFIRMGCYLERADMTSRIIDVQSTLLTGGILTSEDILVQQQRWVSVLKSLSAFQMYRQHVHRPVNGPDTLSFLLQDDLLPRSYSFCLRHIDKCLGYLEHDDAARQALDALTQRLETADLEALAYQPKMLHEFLDSLQLGMIELGSAIATTYFPPPQA